MSIKETIEEKLMSRFAPERLEVINESHRHAGHQPQFNGEGETHFRVRLVANAFSGMSRVERHRTINELLADELAAGVHALAVEPAAPEEQVRW